MDVKELRLKRASLFRQACGFQKKPERVPHMSNYSTWTIFDAGFELSQALTDYACNEEAAINHLTKYSWDAVMGFGIFKSEKVAELLGTNYYLIDDVVGSITVLDHALLESSELRLLAEDPIKVLWEIGMKRRYPGFNDQMTAAQFRKAIDEAKKFRESQDRIYTRAAEEFGMPEVTDGTLGYANFSFEYIFSYLRGIKGFSIDMRRNKADLIAAMDALDAILVEPSVNAIRSSAYGPREDTCWDYSVDLMSTTVFNPRQFEELAWPRIQRVCDALAEKGKTARVIIPGHSAPYIPYFYERYPHNMFTFLLEADDIVQLREKYPDVPFAGGMTPSFLGSASPEEVVERAKFLIREVGSDGGYVMTQNKMGAFRSDGNAENLKALCHFMAEEQE